MLKQILYKEFIEGRTKFDFLFLAAGILLQVIVFSIGNDSLLSFISGLSGIFAVILCSQKKISQFFFAFIQLFTFVILAFQQKFYGKLLENTFYFVTMIIAIFTWIKNLDIQKQEVKAKSLNIKYLCCLIFLTICGIILFGFVLSYSEDTQPYLDSITTVPAFVAQILLMLRYKEQWIFWIFIDVCCIILWIKACNYCMAAQYVFWTANCIYGYLNWKKGIVHD